MLKIKLRHFSFQYDENDMMCFADQENERIAFIQGSEIQLIIDIVDDKLTFHPDGQVNIIEVAEDTYKIESLY